ncbi:hypothetical protein NDA11_001236 [Ustilago hordei]|uniref:Pre-mRNA-splicing factor SPF27 n=1 Tax=Ustilago hordei TaxID=120017 RepID=I2G2I3_USTHO|nr:uncharacterized protein UHO2_02752 [Ustilago hordei]KAJ1584962.1 hypothetical protein NDA15_001362 [Ustilago hordei]KAJ1588428.1 hypothetical protein NDA12_007324 [Ustilago hordei]KAJ1592743.1 hypothetical protein NDA11_001236 [Ustilago hordei]KAJ1601335.1 hypothetical protein NDA14_001480 [Ustilago hordei]UTT94138.1 hypothetical protein NDA17_000092 [Ustilago hordei]
MARGRGRASNGSTASEVPDPATSTSATEAVANGNGASNAGASISGPFRDPFSYHAVELAPTDALPYFDRDLELQPGLRSRVDALVAEEQASMAPIDPTTSSRLPPAYELFGSRPDLRAELERVASGQPSSHTLDSQRYTLPAPEGGDGAPLDAWQTAVDSAHAQLGHMDVRLKNVELMKKYGSNAWRLSNFQQEQDIRLLSEQVDAIKGETNEINRLRQKDQTEAGSKLATLEKRWTELISRGLQLEVANITTQSEIDVLRNKKRKLEMQLSQLE